MTRRTKVLRRASSIEVDVMIEHALLTEPAEVWIARVEEGGIPAGLVRFLGRVYQSPDVEHLGLIDSSSDARHEPVARVSHPYSDSLLAPNTTW